MQSNALAIQGNSALAIAGELEAVSQGSIDWLLARVGMITASRIVDVMNYLKKGGEGADRRNYRMEVIAERLTRVPNDHYITREMQWGIDNEKYARARYEEEKDVFAEKVGFCVHPEMDFAGASPDSLIGDDGGHEIKCPNTTTHIKWMIAGGVPEEHQDQCLFGMDCKEREWWDFQSFDPRIRDYNAKSFIVRMYRDEERIKAIRAEVRKFNDEVNEALYQITRRGLAA